MCIRDRCTHKSAAFVEPLQNRRGARVFKAVLNEPEKRLGLNEPNSTTAIKIENSKDVVSSASRTYTLGIPGYSSTSPSTT